MADTEKQTADDFDLGSNLEILNDIFRILPFLEQRLNQLARKNHLNRSQYPEAFFEMETALHTLRSWAWDWRCFCGVPTFAAVLIASLEELSILVESFLDVETPVKGKKRTKLLSLIIKDSINPTISDFYLQCHPKYPATPLAFYNTPHTPPCLRRFKVNCKLATS